MNLGRVDVELEIGRHVHPHRLVVADPDAPAGTRRVPPVGVEDVGDGEIEVRADDVEVGTVVLQDELALVQPHIGKRRDEPPGPVLPGRVGRRGVRLDRLLRFGILRHKGGETLRTVGERLGEHPPTGHLGRLDQDLPSPQSQPVDGHDDTLGGEKRSITRVETADDKVLHDKIPRGDVDAESPDRDLAVQAARGRLLQRPERNERSQIDGHGGHERCCDDDRTPPRSPTDVAKGRPVSPAAQA